jgi:high frequency lysogenization protein
LQNDYYKITIALAGIFQSVSLVRDLAQTGKANEDAFQASLYSIFQTDPKDVPSIYNGLSGVKIGLENLIKTLGGEPKENRPLMRYVISLIHLQKKITRSPRVRESLRQRLNQAKKQVEYFSLTHSNVIANLADIYISTISLYRFRIMIWGNPRILSGSHVMEKIRALLLAGLRSAVLWRQMGGSRLQLLFSRTKIKATAEKILIQINANQDMGEKEHI